MTTKKKHKRKKTAIGTTVASESYPNTNDSFWFTVHPDVIVNPYDFVTVKQTLGSKTIGIVKELTATATAISTVAVSDYEKEKEDPGAILARVAPMANAADVKHKDFRKWRIEMPVGAKRAVTFSNKKEIEFALGIPDMEMPIPAGIIEMSNGLQVPISLDTSYLLGPDTAHVNASGISGNSKTSYLLFLFHSMYQRLHRNTAFVIFNTKTDDLLHLHENRHSIKQKHLSLYKILGIRPKPLKHVKYFLPRGSDGNPNSTFIPKHAKTYSFELEDVYADLAMLFLQQPGSSTAGVYSTYDLASIVNYISESWPKLRGKIKTWSDLADFDDYPPEIVAHRSSLLKFLEHLHRIRKSTLFIDKKKTSVYLGDQIRQITPGDVIVIDIAMVSSIEEQSFIVGNVVKAINEMYWYREKPSSEAKGAKKPENVAIFLDEINRFVPRPTEGGTISPVADQVIQTLVTGRSRRTVLFSAQQFKSTVHPRLDENTGLHVIAKLGLSELTNENYSMLDESTKMSITRLSKGELVMVHPAFRQPVRIVFPKSSIKP